MKTVERVAVVHDWLTGMRGGERVLEAILELFPDADLFTLLHNVGSVSARIAERRVVTSFVDRLPLKSRFYRHYLPLFPTAIESFDLTGYDLVISSSHCVARGVVTPPGVPHLCYFHSPMRYVWDMYHEYFPPDRFLNRAVIPFFANYLRMWDASAAPRVDAHVCNSAFVASRIKRYYGKESVVIHPPCIADGHQVPADDAREEFYLIVSAFAPYKRIELALEAFQNWGRRLLVVGSGQDEKRLRRYEMDNVRFLGNLSREGIITLYRTARGLVFPGREDFGIVPVEAQAYGCPVIAFGQGGALETVLPDRTGVLFAEQTVDSLREAVLKNEKLRYRREDFQKSVDRFTEGKFKAALLRAVQGLADNRPASGRSPTARSSRRSR